MSIEIVTQEDTPEGTLKEALNISDRFDAVIVLALVKNGGGQYMTTSRMSGIEKGFLLTFFQAWMTKWFQIGDVDERTKP